MVESLLPGVGMVAGFSLTLLLWRQAGGAPQQALNLLFPAAPLVFVGGKLGFLLTRAPGAPAVDILEQGYSLFGAFFLVIGFWLLLRSFFTFPLLRFLDCVTPGAALALSLGRIGCFLRGCCGGTPGDPVWAVRFGRGTPAFADQVHLGLISSGASSSLPVHPVQIYEALFALTVSFPLILLCLRGKRPGLAFFLGGSVYGLFRFAIEFFRIDSVPWPALEILTRGQSYSLALLAAGITGLSALSVRRWEGCAEAKSRLS